MGTFHLNQNEDYLTVNEIGNKRFLMAVMDGCTMGIDSHFASTLIGKLLKKIAKEMDYKAFVEKKEDELEILLKKVMQVLFDALQKLQYQLDLKREELLSTLILGVVDLEARNAEILTIGDGLVCCNHQEFEYEQDNHPDYLGYHLGVDFEVWYGSQKQRLSLESIEDLSIVTDGIFTFKRFDEGEYEELEAASVMDFLLKDKTWSDSQSMLQKKMRFMEKNYGLKPTDDLAIVRLVLGK
ncbi:MAG: protein phosphatase 2C domain-containing protein [Chitinophagales bacterium]